MSGQCTQFVETEALIAAMNGEEEELDRLIADLLPGERTSLARAARWLADVAAGR